MAHVVAHHIHVNVTYGSIGPDKRASISLDDCHYIKFTSGGTIEIQHGLEDQTCYFDFHDCDSISVILLTDAATFNIEYNQ